MLPEEFKAELFQLFHEVDAQVAQARPVCVASGRCCRFHEFGHTLFLSAVEAEVLLDSAPAYSQPADSATCPFQKDKLCTAREPRPLGCRIYFCDPAYQSQAATITENAIRQLKQLCEQHGIAWRYAPLHTFLNERLDSESVPCASSC